VGELRVLDNSVGGVSGLCLSPAADSWEILELEEALRDESVRFPVGWSDAPCARRQIYIMNVGRSRIQPQGPPLHAAQNSEADSVLLRISGQLQTEQDVPVSI
jgi:hypothetical protein